MIHDDIKELLSELNEIAPSIVFGGYLRGLYLGKASSDIDIATNIPIEIIEEKYGHLEKAGRRKTISGHDVFSFKMHRTEKMFIEIVCTTENVLNKAKQADYTINSLMYDGKQIIGNQACFEDMQSKVIRAVDTKIINEDLSTRPYLWLKTIRMTSEFGFGLSYHMYGTLYDHKDVIKDVSVEIMQAEGHKTLNGKGILRAIQYLSAFSYIERSHSLESYHEEKFSVHIQPHQKLCLLAILTNKQTANDFIKFYHLPSSLKERYEELYDAYYSENKVANRLKHQVITIKKIVG